MANRTLRRSYSGVKGSEGDSTLDIRSGDDSNAGIDGSIAEDEQPTNGDGEHNEPNSNSAGRVSYVEIDPDKLGEYINGGGATDGGDSGTRKRRGRKPGSKNRTAAKKAEDSVAPFLMMAHQWAAVFLKTPEIMLSQDEAKQLSDAYTNFCEYHEIPVMSDKRMSEVNMIIALAMVYGPRAIAVRNRLREEAQAKRAKNVTPIQQAVPIN